MRTFQVILALVLVLLALVAAFVAGFVLHGVVYGDTGLSGSQRAQARAAGDLQRQVLDDLAGHYYKPVSVPRLSQTGVQQMVKSLHDRWTVYLPPAQAQAFERLTSGTYSGIGATMAKRGDTLVVTSVFRGSPARQAGLRAGDVIVAIDGKPVAGLPIATATSRIKGPEGSTVTLGLRRGGSGPVTTVTLTRRTIRTPETVARLLHRGGTTIGYIELAAFADGVGETVRNDITRLQSKGAQAFILDLRYNGGGLLDEAVNVTSDFLADGVVVSDYGLHWPRHIYKVNGDPATSLPLVVLVNGLTASASEITAGALQDHRRATIIGTQTFGKGLVQTTFAMPGGALLKMTIAVYFTPNGRNINHKGITPSIKAPDLPKTKADETLDRAVRFLVSGH